MSERLKKCTREEFYAFIRSYPRELTGHMSGMVEPPQVSYRDFTLGEAPDCIVAAYSMPYEPYEMEEHNFRILAGDKGQL